MGGLNRQERRTLERLGFLEDEGMQQSLSDYLEDGGKAVRRRELWAVAQKASMVVHYEMKRNVWWRRWLREIQHQLHRLLPDWFVGDPELRAGAGDDG